MATVKKIVWVFTFVLFFSACNSELSYREMELDRVDKKVRTFFESVEDQNGTHLYFDGDKIVYVFLNGINVIQGEKAIHFSDFAVESDGDVLKVYYNENETEEYSDETLKHQVLYRINKDKEYEIIRAFRNGAEVPFDVVSVSQ